MLFQMHESALLDRSNAPCRVLDPEVTNKDPRAQVQFVPVLQHLNRGVTQPRRILGRKREGKPIGNVDKTLVLSDPITDLAGQPVIEPSDVGAWIVGVVRVALRQRSTRRPSAISDGAQRLPLALDYSLTLTEVDGPSITGVGRD